MGSALRAANKSAEGKDSNKLLDSQGQKSRCVDKMWDGLRLDDLHPVTTSQSISRRYPRDLNAAHSIRHRSGAELLY